MRSQLKQRTRLTHARLDRRISMLDLADPGDYVTFLQTHHAAYSVLSQIVPADHWISATLNDALAALSCDLTQLQAEPVRTDGMIPVRDVHPLAVAYVIAGSHFGKHILHRRWSKSDDPLVLSAGAYLSNSVLKDAWTRLMAAFAAIGSPDQMAQQLGPDADWVFTLFIDCLVQAEGQRRAYAAA